MIRFHWVAVAALLLGAGSWPLAGSADADSHRQAIERLFELTDMRQKIEESVDNVLLMQINQNPSLAQHETLVRQFLEQTIGWQGLKEDLTQMYLQTFTEDEVNEMNAFYGSPTGRKVITQLPDLVQQRNRLAMQRLQAHIGELQQLIQEHSEQQGAPAAPPAEK
jgi:hypothetical protein